MKFLLPLFLVLTLFSSIVAHGDDILRIQAIDKVKAELAAELEKRDSELWAELKKHDDANALGLKVMGNDLEGWMNSAREEMHFHINDMRADMAKGASGGQRSGRRAIASSDASSGAKGPNVFSCTAGGSSSCAVSFTTDGNLTTPELGIVAKAQHLQMHGAVIFTQNVTFKGEAVFESGGGVTASYVTVTIATHKEMITALQETNNAQQETNNALQAMATAQQDTIAAQQETIAAQQETDVAQQEMIAALNATVVDLAINVKKIKEGEFAPTQAPTTTQAPTPQPTWVFSSLELVGGVIDDAMTNSDGANIFDKDRNVVCVPGNSADGFAVVKIGDGGIPTVIAEVSDSSYMDGIFGLDFDAVRRILIAFGRTSNAVSFYSMEDEYNPVFLGVAQDSTALNGPFQDSSASAVNIDEAVVYAPCTEGTRLTAVDYSNPAAPVIRGSVTSSR